MTEGDTRRRPGPSVLIYLLACTWETGVSGDNDYIRGSIILNHSCLANFSSDWGCDHGITYAKHREGRSQLSRCEHNGIAISRTLADSLCDYGLFEAASTSVRPSPDRHKVSTALMGQKLRCKRARIFQLQGRSSKMSGHLGHQSPHCDVQLQKQILRRSVTLNSNNGTLLKLRIQLVSTASASAQESNPSFQNFEFAQ